MPVCLAFDFVGILSASSVPFTYHSRTPGSKMAIYLRFLTHSIIRQRRGDLGRLVGSVHPGEVKVVLQNMFPSLSKTWVVVHLTFGLHTLPDLLEGKVCIISAIIYPR